VTNGLFTTQIDFGSNAFTGDARWLAITVACPSGGSYTALNPREALTSAPMALALPGMYTQQNATSPNVIGGYSGNTVDPGVVGATIGGGGNGLFGTINHVSGNYDTIGGGENNTASSDHATVGGGETNTASASAATVGGGQDNTASFANATVGGGRVNTASGNGSFVGGGGGNTASAYAATVGGGVGNIASGNGSFVGGGGYDGTGLNGNVAGGNGSAVVGGVGNLASGYASFVGGGGGFFPIGSSTNAISNTASGNWSVVSGGASNIASGAASTVPGGNANVAKGIQSFAAGTAAHAMHDGTFVWADSTSYGGFSSTAANQFLVRASGGITMYTNSAATIGVQVASGSGSWASVSDRNVKANFQNVNSQDMLARVNAIPIQTWNYTTQDASIRHIGPMAQDFYGAFNVGEDDTHITTIDSEGVALAAIQGLDQVVQEKDAEISGLKSQVASQQKQIDSQDARLTALEQAMKDIGVVVRTESDAASTPWLLFGGMIFVGVVFWRQNARGK
jgi:uncharacterized coiled-coil protein SlyX